MDMRCVGYRFRGETMTKRKSLSKKTRFEVFKRDSFKCQYCGSTSPDVILEVDHIKPASEGGGNDLINLITACFDCNRGKSDVMLDDDSVLERQRKQLEEINERRNQLEMMMEWGESLEEFEQEKIRIILNKWNEYTNSSISETGENDVKKWIKKYDFNLILDSVKASANRYIEYDKSGEVIQNSLEKTFDMVPRIIRNIMRDKEEPYMKDLYYIRGILRNRLYYYNHSETIKYLKLAHLEAGYSIESLTDFAKNVRNWTNFESEMLRVLHEEGIDF